MLWPFRALCALLPCELAGQWFAQIQQPIAPSPHKVAIIGAGAAGSSAAFWLSKAQERNNVSITIDIYESSDYIGGRSTVVYPYDSPEYLPVELGASIFVKANKNLMRAAKEFNLTLDKFDDDNGITGVWDGEQFLIKFGGSWMTSWWNKLRIVWRYGVKAPTNTQKLVQDMISSYSNLYTSGTPRWHNISEVAAALGFNSAVNQTMADYLDSYGIDHRWSREMVEAATRVNYGQNIDAIHALGGMCSMAANGAVGVKGGNFQIFQHFINQSHAKLHLNSTITRIERVSSQWLLETPSGVKIYDSVILAAPLTSALSLVPAPAFQPVPYVHLHVTLLTTTSPFPNSTYFAGDSKPPTSILTSFEGARNGLKGPPFNSISYHGRIAEGKDEWVVKIFSESKLTKKWLRKVFNNQVGWVLHKEWDAYPVLVPTSVYPQVQLADGLYYVNAFEPFMSTMETETIASRNVADLLFQTNFNATICGSKKLGSVKDDFVYGWDC